MIKNKYNFFVFSMAFFIVLIFLACTPATEASNKFISGLCLGFLLSQGVFLLYVSDDKIEDLPDYKSPKENYLSDYWWNDGKRPNSNNNQED